MARLGEAWANNVWNTAIWATGVWEPASVPPPSPVVSTGNFRRHAFSLMSFKRR